MHLTLLTMSDDFDSDFDLPWPTKVKAAKIAFAGAVATAVIIGAILSVVLDSFQTALANVGIAAPNLLPLSVQVAGVAGFFSFVFLGIYCGISRYARRFVLRLNP